MKILPGWNFEGEVVCVSAGAWGIGRAIVSLFARSGARVIFGDIDVLHGEELVEMLRAEGCEVTFVEADFADPEAWPRLLRAEPTWKPSILISNAGVSGLGAVENLDLEKYERVHAVNQRAGLIGAKCVVPHMKARGEGSIVFIGSIMAHAIFTNSVSYVATKAAIEGVTRALATDLGPSRIRVNCVMPGFTKVGMSDPQRDRIPPHLWTAFAEEFAGDFDSDYEVQQPLAVGADSADVAQAVAFLCSDSARCITGATLPVDGGLSLPVASEMKNRLRLINWTHEMEMWVQRHSEAEESQSSHRIPVEVG